MVYYSIYANSSIEFLGIGTLKLPFGPIIMTSSLPKRPSNATPLHYRLTNEEWLKAVRELKPRERDILYYLRTLDPFGDRELDLSTRQVAKQLGCSASTVSDALKALGKKGWIELEIVTAKVRLKSAYSQPPKESDRPSDHRSPQRSVIAGAIAPLESDRWGDPPIAGAISDRPSDQLEVAVQTALQGFSTVNDFLPKQTDQICSKNTGGEPVENWSLTTGNIDSKADLISVVSQGCTYLENVAGVPINAPLKAVIDKIAISTPERFKGRIEAAVYAYLEQRPEVKSPQAFISAALQRGFTSNDWKKTQKSKASETPKSTERENIPCAAVADLSGLLIEIQTHCERLEITTGQALERFGRAGKHLSMLSDIDLATLRSEMVGW